MKWKQEEYQKNKTTQAIGLNNNYKSDRLMF